MSFIHPLVKALGTAIHALENPLQYLGGEFGAIRKEANYRTAVIFPDTYTIGMSNYSIKVLYDLINRLSDISAERAFAPDRAMEALLRQHNIDLMTIESGIPLHQLDLLAISVGFELSFTNILSVLDLGGVALRSVDRSEQAPLVIGGGPALTNPAPFGPFFDAIIIGEAEAVLPSILAEQQALKLAGASRQDKLSAIQRYDSAWFPSKTAITTRAIWHGFSTEFAGINYPVPTLKVAQDHGVAEIMRGCPQGCRFCHAGVYYRPFRQRSPKQIIRHVDQLLLKQGYRSITLSSLSSGDYPGIQQLFSHLNQRYGRGIVNFGLPSLKVNSFNLDLIDELSSGKKSGLTFAVETPALVAQKGINKLVSLEDTIRIGQEAKSRGWRSAKLYFMVGLPVAGYQNAQEESAAIENYIHTVQKETRLSLNVTIGTFVPKPHTPFERAAQLKPEAAHSLLVGLKNRLASQQIKLNYQDSFHSFLEGVIARGDARVADLVQEAWQRGARFDAWDEQLDRNLWRTVFSEASWSVEDTVCNGFSLDESLAWNLVNLGVHKRFLESEAAKTLEGELSQHCQWPCTSHCGICTSKAHAESAPELIPESIEVFDSSTLPRRLGEIPKDNSAMLFGFSRKGSAVFIPHLSLVNTLERALLRSSIPFGLSNGFSPQSMLEIAQALSVGVESQEEMAIIQLHSPIASSDFMSRMNQAMPEGLEIVRAELVYGMRLGRKAPSLSSLASAAVYDLKLPASIDNSTLEGSLKSGEQVLALRGPLSLRHQAEALLGREYLAKGLVPRRLCLCTDSGQGFDAFLSHFEPWDITKDS